MEAFTVYWVDAPYDDTIQLTGTVPDVDQVNLPRGMSLFAPEIETLNLSELPGNLRAYRFDGPRLRPTRTLFPGTGYCMVAREPTTITIRSAR